MFILSPKVIRLTLDPNKVASTYNHLKRTSIPFSWSLSKPKCNPRGFWELLLQIPNSSAGVSVLEEGYYSAGCYVPEGKVLAISAEAGITHRFLGNRKFLLTKAYSEIMEIDYRNSRDFNDPQLDIICNETGVSVEIHLDDKHWTQPHVYAALGQILEVTGACEYTAE